MKKLMAMILAFVMMVSLVACGGESTSENKAEGGEQSAKEKLTFTELTVVDNEQCVIKITGIDPDGFMGYTLNAYYENKSADTTYMFSVDSAAINGVQSDPFSASEVAPGKKSNADISFSGDELEENGVGDYTDIELTFRVYDSDNILADNVVMKTVHIYPYGEEKAVQYTRESQASDTILLDNEEVSVIVTGYSKDDIWGYTVEMYLVNKTDKEVMISWDDVSVNGYMIDPFFAKSVLGGKVAFSRAFWSNDAWEENGITDVTSIEFLLKVYEADNYLTGEIVKQNVTLNP